MSDLIYAQREIDNLINLLADTRTESMRLRAALEELLWYTNQLELAVYDPAEWPSTHGAVRAARAALEEGMTSPDEREDCTGLEDSSTANPCGREDCEEGEGL